MKIKEHRESFFFFFNETPKNIGEKHSDSGILKGESKGLGKKNLENYEFFWERS